MCSCPHSSILLSSITPASHKRSASATASLEQKSNRSFFSCLKDSSVLHLFIISRIWSWPMLKVVCCDVVIIRIFILNIGANIRKYFQFPKKKDKKLRFYGFLDYSNTLLAIIARRNRGKGTGKQGTRRHVTGRDTAFLSIRTPARTNQGGRPYILEHPP